MDYNVPASAKWGISDLNRVKRISLDKFQELKVMIYSTRILTIHGA